MILIVNLYVTDNLPAPISNGSSSRIEFTVHEIVPADQFPF